MTSKELIIVRENQKEILDFLERVRVYGSARVEVGSIKFIVDVRPEKISESGRQFLIDGGQDS